jgi:hypothetical protein
MERITMPRVLVGDKFWTAKAAAGKSMLNIRAEKKEFRQPRVEVIQDSGILKDNELGKIDCTQTKGRKEKRLRNVPRQSTKAIGDLAYFR